MKGIFASLLTILSLWVPIVAFGQNPGVVAPPSNAMKYLYQDPPKWTGRYYTTTPSLSDRLYFNLGGEYGALWSMFEDNISRMIEGSTANLTAGYRLSPVHNIEAGLKYGSLKGDDNHFAFNMAYLFDVTAYASRTEVPGKWQLLAKVGAEVDVVKPAAVAGTGAMRVQYNFMPGVGVYVEPKVSFYVYPAYSYTHSYGWTDPYTSISFGASLSTGRLASAYRTQKNNLVDSYRTYRTNFLDRRWWDADNYFSSSNITNRLYFTVAGEGGCMMNFSNNNLTDLSAVLNAHAGVGYYLTPIHAIEVGATYGRLRGSGGHYGFDLSYLFDVTAYALQRETPGKWQFLTKFGVETADFGESTDTAAAGVAALRLQYNVLPTMGLYFEPKAAVYMTQNNNTHYNRGCTFASMSFGASFNVGRLSLADRTRIKTLPSIPKWGGNYFTVGKPFDDKLYFTTSLEAGFILGFTLNNFTDARTPSVNAHVGLGYQFAPVHALEAGISYGHTLGNGGHYSLDLSYLFDVTAYALQRETPGKWQFFTKFGVENTVLGSSSSSLAGVGALRLQYNVLPQMGIYAEPKVAMYAYPNGDTNSLHSCYGRGNTYASLSFGASFNVGKLGVAQRAGLKNMPDIPTWSGSKYSKSKDYLDKLYLNFSGEYGATWNFYLNTLYGGFPKYSAGNVAVGYNLSPVHSVEAGIKYGAVRDCDGQINLHASYLFDVTSYALCRETPSTVQLFLKTGIECEMLEDTSRALNGAMRLQYNVSSKVGIYLEPKLALHLTNQKASNALFSRGDMLTTLALGVSTRF